ncbi:hypothetical protein OROMI_029752 [Orobanche minor]
MTVLSSKKILQEQNSSDPNSITSLSLTQRALSDVSCLSEFKNLGRLDLGFNNLTSLEGLKSCINLKWLSVAQNKLQSLKGVECLTNLYVLNAGKNKLISMDEVKSLASLRALILNENEISSVCKLDKMKELNTLVLSRNPITSLGDSLVKLKSITKLSLSNCQLQTIGSSLKSCLELKELRLAHNEIMNVPSEFGLLVKLQNLDMGNNLITNRSNLKVLSSLVNLRNLNLQGNPIAEKENLLNKVKKLLPNLQVLNARPIGTMVGIEVHEKANDFSTETDLGSRKKRKELQDGKNANYVQNTKISNKQMEKKSKLKPNGIVNPETPNIYPEEANKSKHKKQKADRPDKDSNASGVTGRETDKKSREKIKGDKANIIDSAESPFTDLFANISALEVPKDTADKKLDIQSERDIDAISGLVIRPIIKKKNNRVLDPAAFELSQADKIGLGGPSAWD